MGTHLELLCVSQHVHSPQGREAVLLFWEGADHMWSDDTDITYMYGSTLVAV